MIVAGDRIVRTPHFMSVDTTNRPAQVIAVRVATSLCCRESAACSRIYSALLAALALGLNPVFTSAPDVC